MGRQKKVIEEAMGQAETFIEKTSDAIEEAVAKTLNKTYEEWKVKPIYEKQRGNDGSMVSVYVGCEKDAQKPIRTTVITPEKAAILNSQSENTLVHLFEV